MAEEKSKDKQSSSEPVYWYMENGLMVFTEAYHLKRGYCCRNGCRHCPYGFKRERKNKRTDNE